MIDGYVAKGNEKIEKIGDSVTNMRRHYHGIRASLSIQNCCLGKGFVMISDIYSFVDKCSMVIIFLIICDLKW